MRLETRPTLKTLLSRSAALAALATLTSNPVLGESEGYEHISTAASGFSAVRILDTDAMPVGERQGSPWGAKTLFEHPEGGHLQMVYIPPGAPGAYIHYHDFHEWAWIVSGDFTNNESTHPDQVYGPLQRFVAGDFLTRPPYSLHGGEKGRQDFMASQTGSVILIMEEGIVYEHTYTVDPACAREDVECGDWMARRESVDQWTTPRIIDTINDMPFQPVEGTPGLKIKRLADDPSHGFRATMWFLEAGAETPERFLPHYYEQAHQFNFIINGDLKFQAYGDTETPAEVFTVSRNFSVERPPMSILGLPETGATEGGVVWLEVTYAKNARWTYELTPIEAPNYIAP